MVSDCPSPKKVRHGNAWDAAAHRRALQQHKGASDLYVYPCCDHWHVGCSFTGQSAAVRKRIRRILIDRRWKK